MGRAKTAAIIAWFLVGSVTLVSLVLLVDHGRAPAAEPEPAPVEPLPQDQAAEDTVADPGCTADVWTCKAVENDWAVFVMTGAVVTKGVAGAARAVRLVGGSSRERRHRKEMEYRMRRMELQHQQAMARIQGGHASPHPLAQPRRRAYRPVQPRLLDDAPRHRAA